MLALVSMSSDRATGRFSPAEEQHVLPHTVFENGELPLLEVGDESPLAVGDRHVQGDHIDAGAKDILPRDRYGCGGDQQGDGDGAQAAQRRGGHRKSRVESSGGSAPGTPASGRV